MIAPAFALAAMFALGAFSWTLAEYTLHRFAMHEMRGRGKASKEHLRHHAAFDHNPGTTALSWTGVFVVAATVFFPIGLLVNGLAGGIALGSGWIVGYAGYEYLHWAAHRKAPRTAYEAWVRRHHFHHHFGHPMMNHGVTTTLWDRVFGTLDVPDFIKVPRRMAMVWLLDDDGELRPEYQDSYVLVGRSDRDERGARRDLEDAYANLAPAL